jgi:hypothetical protein
MTCRLTFDHSSAYHNIRPSSHLQPQRILRILLLASNTICARLGRVSHALGRVTDARGQTRSRIANAFAQSAHAITDS